MKNKKSLALLAGVLSATTPLLCQPASAGVLSRIRHSINGLWGQSAAHRGAARDAYSRAAALDSQAEALHDRLEKAQQLFLRANGVYLNYAKQVKETEARIIEARHRVQIAQARYEDHKKLFGARLASIQRNGQIGYLNMLLGSRTLSDLSRRAYLYQAITERDIDMQTQLKADREELEVAQKMLTSQWKQRHKLEQAAMEERGRVVSAQKEQTRLWKEIKSNVYAQLAYAAAKEQTAEQLESDIQQLESQRSQIVAAYESQYPSPRRYRSYHRYRRRRVARHVTRTQYVKEGGVLKPMAIKDIVYEDVMVPVEEKSEVLSEDYHVEGDGHKHSSSEWVLPGRGRLSSRYGMRYHPILHRRKLHTGDDIAAGYGSTIKAARGGRVLYSGWKKGYGNTVIIDHGGGVTTLYGHASKIGVKAGQPIKAGEYIANVGSTGYSTGPHLHFEVRKNGKPVDPTPYLRKAKKN